MGSLLRSCAEVCELTELSFGMVSRVGPGIDVLDGVHVLQGEGAVSGMVSGIFRGMTYCSPRNVFN